MLRSGKKIVPYICVAVCAAILISVASVPKLVLQSSARDSSKAPAPKPANRLVAFLGKGTPHSNSKLPATFTQLQKKYNLVAIPTYDGSYQLTHPKVLYFPKGWNGYQYWMSMTPYPHGHDIYENPSIVVSNDGKTWAVPAGLKNPVTGLPPDVKTGGHYSDSHIVMNGNTMELWYRYNPAMAQKGNYRRPNNNINIYYRKTSTDGIHWTAGEKLLQSTDGHLSLCVNHENGVYKTWFATYGGDLYSADSKNALNWMTPVRCTVPLPKGYQPYHQDMIHYGSKYYLLQTAQKKSNYTFQLFLLQSDDGIHFSGTQQIYPSKDMALWKNVSFYRSTLFVKDNKLNLYVSMIIPRLKWFVTQMTIPLPQSAPAAKPAAKTAVRI